MHKIITVAFLLVTLAANTSPPIKGNSPISWAGNTIRIPISQDVVFLGGENESRS